MKNYFETICQIAKDKDETRLLNLLTEEGVTIDESQRGLMVSPAGACACNGDIESAEWLRRFGAKVKWIAEGAARGGHFHYAESLRKNHGALVSSIVFGASCGGHKQYAKMLREQYEVDINTIPAGAVIHGDIEYAENLRGQDKTTINILAELAALSGRIKYAETLRTHFGADINVIAQGAARGGHIEYAETLLKGHKADKLSIALGAASGGYIQYAETLRKRYYLNSNVIAENATYGGHVKYAKYLHKKRGAEINRIVFGLCNGRHLTKLNNIYYFLISIKSDISRLEYAIAFEKHTPSSELRHKIPKILVRASRTAYFKKKYRLEFAPAEFISQGDNYLRYAIWFMQVAHTLNTKNGQPLSSELIHIITQHASGLSARHTQQLWEIFANFRAQKNENTSAPDAMLEKLKYIAIIDLLQQCLVLSQNQYSYESKTIPEMLLHIANYKQTDNEQKTTVKKSI